MGVIMAERTLKRTAQRYRRGTRKQKARILDELVATHDCTRNHASWLLRSWGKTVFSHQGGELVKIVVGQRRARRTSPRVYDQQVYEALERIWYLYGGMCGKRLIGVLRNQLPLLEKFDEISLDAVVREKLQGISAATIDRLLRAEKRKLQVRGRSHTKPTTRLLHKIPIRTFAEWQDAKVGEMGADLVGHDGGYGGGEHAFTLLLTDRVTQWTEPRAVLNKAQKWVFQALLQVRSWLPFVLVGLHTDCGGEFINHNLARYCRAPWKGAVSQRVRIPPGNCRSSRKQSERCREVTKCTEALR